MLRHVGDIAASRALHTSITQRVVGDNSHITYQHVILWFGVLLDEAAQTDITRTLTRDWFYRRASHTGGWWVSVSPTLVESYSMNMVLSEDQKAITIPRCGF